VSRRLSQAISEGDGISLIVHVGDVAAARAAEAGGAGAVLATASVHEVRAATELPVLAYGDGGDACLVDSDHDGAAASGGAELAVRVEHEEQLSDVLERLDPELLVLAAQGEDEPLEHVLALLSDVPVGKLAIVELDGATRADIDELERAGVDAVLLRAPLAGT
jgi:hypothetical protein